MSDVFDAELRKALRNYDLTVQSELKCISGFDEDHGLACQEAVDYLAGQKRDGWPCLSPEVEMGRCGSLREAAELVRRKHAARQDLLRDVRRERLLGKDMLRKVRRVEDIPAAMDAAIERIAECFRKHLQEQENGK